MKKNEGVMRLIGLSLGVTASQLALILIGLSDSAMMGRFSSSGLAAGTLVSSLYNLAMLFCMGMIIPIAIQLGKNRDREAGKISERIVADYYKMAVLLTVLTIVFLTVAVDVHTYIGKDAQVVTMAKQYTKGIVPGILPWILFYLIRNILLCYQKVKLTTILSVFSILLNLGLNYICIYGIGIFQGFGISGCAIATSITNWIIFLIAFAVLRKNKKIIPEIKNLLQKNGFFGESLKLGFPTGMVFFSEYLVFAFGNSLLSSISTTAVAAFGIAVSWLNLFYMFPVALSQVLTEPLAGYYVAGKMDQFVKTSKASLFVVLLYNIIVMFGICIFRNPLISFILGANVTEEVCQLAEEFMLIIILVIFAYNFIVVLSGILRGFGDVKTPLLMMFIMYWLVGLGGTALFTYFTGVYGVLFGMCFGFTLTCIGVFHTYRKKIRSECIEKEL